MKRFFFILSFLPVYSAMAEKPFVVVGSKPFTENYILGEILSQVIESVGEVEVVRKPGLGGSGVIHKAMLNGKLDLYVEYTGTAARVMLKKPELVSIEQIRKSLKEFKIIASDSIGFNNTYALTVRKSMAERLGLRKISDLKNHLDTVRVGFHPEFFNRPDGYVGLKRVYGLNFSQVRTMEHSITYEALKNKVIDMTDGYSTDAKMERYNLVMLEDDKEFFPKYYSFILAKEEIIHKYPKTWEAVRKLEHSIDEAKMISLNAMVEIDKKSFEEVAALFLKNKLKERRFVVAESIWKHTKEHSFLIFISLLFSLIVAIPLGVFAAKSKPIARAVLVTSELLQTVPSLALLCLMIPFFGIGVAPALCALFLYALLPIVRNTYLGLSSIDTALIESARSMGMSKVRCLFSIELPLASPSIMTGIKTSTIINVGTATLAAFIGAGGYGVPIVRGLALNDTSIILTGAIPAAIFGLLLHGAFEWIDRGVVPKGLTISSSL